MLPGESRMICEWSNAYMFPIVGWVCTSTDHVCACATCHDGRRRIWMILIMICAMYQIHRPGVFQKTHEIVPSSVRTRAGHDFIKPPPQAVITLKLSSVQVRNEAINFTTPIQNSYEVLLFSLFLSQQNPQPKRLLLLLLWQENMTAS